MQPVRNILFITADQWRGECLSALDHPVVRTPNLDALAAEGVLFASHFANCAPCAPSRASLHTGQYLMNHRVCGNGTPLDARFTNWALEVRKAGYDPVLFGYTDTAQDPRRFDPRDPILTTYEEVLPGLRTMLKFEFEAPRLWIDWLRDLGYPVPARIFDTYLMTRDGVEWEDGGPEPLPLAIAAEHHDTRYMVDRFVSWRRGQMRPWVAHLSLLRPHPPFIAPEPYNRMYDPASLSSPQRAATREEEGALHPWLMWQTSRKGYGAPDDERAILRRKASYFGLMSEVDDNLGRLFDDLRKSGEWENTLIVFTSDHGEQMGDHWLMSKTGFFDQSYRIPLIIRDPRRQADASRGKVVRAFTENVDIMPTMLDALDMPVPDQCDGRPLSPFLHSQDGPDAWRANAFWEYDFRDVENDASERALDIDLEACSLAVLRGQRWKYVHFAGLEPLLFDLESDPGETRNLATDPAHATTVAACAQAMLDLRMTRMDRALSRTKLTANGPVSR